MSALREEMNRLQDKLGKKIGDPGQTPLSSKTDYISITTALLNSPDETITHYYQKDVDGVKKTEEVVGNPSKDFRDAVKDFTKSTLKVDDGDLAAMDDSSFSKKMGEAVINVATDAMQHYLSLGRKVVLHPIQPNQTDVGLFYKKVKESIIEPKRIVKTDDGNFVQEPTGKKIKKHEHFALKVDNTILPSSKEDITDM